MDRIQVNQRFSVPRSELTFRATRSGGPGGQHANTSSTRIELTWNVGASPSLSDRRRALLLNRLSNRIDAAGVLRIVVATHRSQHRNREEAVDRFARLLADALRPRKQRKPTRPPRAVKEKRIEAKKRRSRTKELRRPVRPDES